VPIVATVKEVFSYLYNKLLDRDPFAQERGSPPVAAAASAGEGETGDNA
jgi:hypothetical protein